MKTLWSAIVWLSGVVCCVLFLGLLLPREGPPGHQWFMPLGARGSLFFGGGCLAILTATYFIDKYGGPRK